jgi:hypothetical protein
MKKLTILLIIVFAAGRVNAQTKITGTVKDNRGHIVVGASIQVKG